MTPITEQPPLNKPIFPVKRELPTVVDPMQMALEKISEYLFHCGLEFTHAPNGAIVGVNMCHTYQPTLSVQINGMFHIIQSGMAWESIRQWVLGDIVNLGFKLKGEEFAHFLPADKTLSNWSSICNQYTHEQRNIPIGFTHYASVAYVEDRRARAKLLSQAHEKNWTVRELEQARNLDAGNPTPSLNYEFTVFNGVSSAIKLSNGGSIDKAQYEELIGKYGKGECSVDITILVLR